MNINNNKEYKNFINYLYTLKDEKYKNFHQKLLKNNNINLIGIRTPILKKLAKEISINPNYYINNSHQTYEEILIHGLTLGYLKIEFKELLNLLDKFIPYIDNWATCDLTVSNLKQFKKNQIEGFKYIEKCIKEKNIWKQRVGIVLINSYYINDNYINKIIKLLKDLDTDEYYVQMAISWALSTCYIKYPDITINILKEKKLNTTIHNKTIQKIIESTRIDKKTKEKLKQLKIKT